MNMTITETSAERAADIAQLIRDAHRDVAELFALSEDNCPRHTAFCSADRVAAEFARGERYFLCGENRSLVEMMGMASRLAGLPPPRLHVPYAAATVMAMRAAAMP